MIDINWLEIILFLSMIYVRSTEAASCPQSRETVESVPSCPKSKEEWERRADAKQCSRQKCENDEESVYHCVINIFANETLEVCAPKARIMGRSCVEYNVRGAIIQQSQYKCNKSCPFSYNSTDVYKYQECFKAITIKNRTDNVNTSSTEASVILNFNSNISRYAQEDSTYCVSSVWQIVAVLMIAFNVILFILISALWLISRNKNQSFKKCQAFNCISCKKGPEIEGEQELEEAEHMIKSPPRTGAKGKPEVSRDEQQLRPGEAAHMTGLRQSKGETGLCVAGIDIGDSFLTMALSKEKFPEDIPILGTSERIALLFDKSNKCIAFGDEAFRQFTENESSKDLRYEDGFKLSDVEQDSRSYESLIYKSAIEQILKKLYQELDKELSKKQQSSVHYVFVVPTYWSDGAKEKLRREILENKSVEHQSIDKEHLHLVSREQTLLTFIHKVKARVVCLNFDVDNLILNTAIRDYSYAILHIGSTYCDLVFLKVEQGKEASTLPCVKRHQWDKLPRRHFLDHLGYIYGNNVLNTWEEKHRRDCIKLVYEFEKLHKNRAKYTDEPTAFALDLPKSLTSKKKIVNTKDVDPKTNKLNVTHKFLNTFFKEIKGQVKEWIISERESFRGVTCVIMTGTYSKMEIFWDEAEEEWFKGMNVTIAVPENVQVFAMGGAYNVQKEKQNAFTSK